MRVQITPDDVGSRVSVRSRHHGDADGPSMTDAVGDLVEWADGYLHIRRRGGTVAVVAEGDLLAGKVLPEAPPRRPQRYPR